MTDRTITINVPQPGQALTAAVSVAAIVVASIALWRISRRPAADLDFIPAPDFDTAETRERREDRERRAKERKAKDLELTERRLAFEEAREARLTYTTPVDVNELVGRKYRRTDVSLATLRPPRPQTLSTLRDHAASEGGKHERTSRFR